MTTLQMDDAIGDQAILRLEQAGGIVAQEMQNIKEQVSSILHYGDMWKGASATEFFEEFGKAGEAFNEQLSQMMVLQRRLLMEVSQWKIHGHKLIG
jgi:uncharacterized protein YukE